MKIGAVIREKERYRAWSAGCRDLPLYMKHWYLDAVCAGYEWQAVMLEDVQGDVVAAMPFMLRKYYGMSVIMPPYMCAYQGPWVRASEDPRRGYIKDKMRYWQIVEHLIDALPKVAVHLHQTLPGEQDLLPFHWKGFQQSLRYTFCIEDLGDAQRCFDAFKGNIRTNIRKAASLLHVEKTEDVAALWQVHNCSFKRQGTNTPITQERLRAVYTQCAQHSAATMYLAKDAQGRVFAGALAACDDSQVYVLLSGVDDALGNIGALNLCYWQIIQDHAGRYERLDFEGSMLPGVAPVFLAFGARQIPYAKVLRFGNRAIEWLVRGAGKV